MPQVVPLAGAPRQTRKTFIATAADVLSTTTTRLAGNNKWRVKMQLVNRGPQSLVLAETPVKAARGEGIYIDAGQQPFVYDSPGELYGLALPSDTIAVNPPAGALLTWTSSPIDFLVWSADAAVAQVSIGEEIEA